MTGRKRSAPKSLLEQGNILEMDDLRHRLHLRWPNDFDHIEPVGQRTLAQPGEVGLGGTAQHSLFPRIHRVKSRHERIGGPGFHFDKNQRLAIAAYEIDFVPAIARSAPVACHDGEATFAFQPLSREAFAARAGIARISCKEFSEPRKHTKYPV